MTPEREQEIAEAVAKYREYRDRRMVILDVSPAAMLIDLWDEWRRELRFEALKGRRVS